MDTPRVVGVVAYLIAFVALIVAIWQRAGEADRAQDELDRRNNRSS